MWQCHMLPSAIQFVESSPAFPFSRLRGEGRGSGMRGSLDCQRSFPMLPISPFATRKRDCAVKFGFLPHRTHGPDLALQMRLQG